MLRFQITLTIIFVGCIAFLSCNTDTPMDRTVDRTVDVVMDGTAMDAYKSWTSVKLPAPEQTADAALENGNFAEAGQVHGTGTRTVYFNEVGATANMEGAITYPTGTMIVKEAMDPTNTSIEMILTMMKSDDPMYAVLDGWVYGIYGLQRQFGVEEGGRCHSCHAQAANDSVFVSLQ